MAYFDKEPSLAWMCFQFVRPDRIQIDFLGLIVQNPSNRKKNANIT